MRFLGTHGVTRVRVPDTFPLALARELEKKYEVVSGGDHLFPERARKTEWEIEEIANASKAVDASLCAA